MPDGTGETDGRSSDPTPSLGRAGPSRRGKGSIRRTGTVQFRLAQGRGRRTRGRALAALALPQDVEVDGTNTVERAQREVLVPKEDVEGPWRAGVGSDADCSTASLAVEICNVARLGRGLGGRRRYW